MGLTTFNAMRAKRRMAEHVLNKDKVEPTVVPLTETVEDVKPTVTETVKRTDAEKLKKGKKAHDE